MADKVETPADWPAQATDTIVKVVGQVRDKTTGPIITIARGVVYGTLAAILGTVAAVLTCILLVRALSIPVEELWGRGNIWAVYLFLGVIFTAVGWYLMKKASAAPVDR
jgi:uncharacterized BrkB/YihY/UPF0761 family membrane protein